MLHTPKLLLTVILLVSLSLSSQAQTFENAGQYMDFISKANAEITTKYLFYLSGVSHGKSARKVEKRRMEVVNAISETRYSIMGMPPWKGDRTLKDTSAAYLKMLYNVFNEDYGKIVNMEEIAEQSYDAMEAYMLAQEKAQEKLQAASKKQHDVQKRFAEKNNITLIDTESELEAKSKIVEQVMGHTNDVYLIFFKAYKQEAYLMDAIDKKNMLSIEQNLSSLKKFGEDGQEKLKTLTGYKEDGSLIAACNNVLQFYQAEADKGKVFADYFLKEEDFGKLKKKFDAKPANKRTEQEVNEYNKAAQELNTLSNGINTTLNELNKQRASALNAWNKAYSKYLDNHIPTQQRQ